MTIEILDRHGRPITVTSQAPSSLQVEKAATGIGVTALTYGVPLWSLANTPQRRAYQAAALYATHNSIHKAESTVSDTAGAVGWHLEDAAGKEIDDDSDPALKAIRDLLETPQAGLPFRQRQAGLNTFRAMLTVTLRHQGLCGTGFWYLDQTEALSGTPLAIMYLSPWRLFEVRDRDTGGFLGWTLDGTKEDGGRPIEAENILPFYLSPPDDGNFSHGLVEAAAGKVPLGPAIDRHVLRVISAGGRLAGMISPKQGTVVSADDWKQFVSDYRNITSSDDAALKLQIVQGAVDFVKTAADMNELAVVEIDDRTDRAINELWKVPGSQTGADTSAGLNSGDTKGYDEAVLWQRACHPRLISAYETIQYGLLDRFKALGLVVELVFEEPEFDDDTPQFEKAVKASAVPMRNNERRDLIGLPPLDATLKALGEEVWMPTTWGRVTDQASEPPPPPVAPPFVPPGGPPPEPAKATLSRFEKVRRSMDERLVPLVRKSVLGVLTSQKAEIVAYLRKAGLDHLKRKVDFRWDAKRADRELSEALRPHLETIASRIAGKTRADFPAKATDTFAESVTRKVLTKGAGRVVGINRTTQTAIQQAISDALKTADTITDVITAVEDLDIFGELRAETIARTESMFAYNAAALGSYEEMGVTEVEAIDGDEDEECASRDGQVYSIEEAQAIEDHPNGTLDWAPIVPDEPPAKAESKRVSIEYDEIGRIAGWVRA